MKFFTTVAPLLLSLVAVQTTLAAPLSGSHTHEIGSVSSAVNDGHHGAIAIHQKRGWKFWQTSNTPKLPKDIARKAKEADALFAATAKPQQPQQLPVPKPEPQPMVRVKGPLVLGPDAAINPPKIPLNIPKKMGFFENIKFRITNLFSSKPKTPIVTNVKPVGTVVEF